MDASEEKKSEGNLSDEKETLEDPVVNDSLIDSTKPKIKNTEPKLNKSDAETLFYNRQAFLRFNRFKIDRTLSTLSEIDRTIFSLIPRLLHVHQEGLPGYFEGNPPCGIHNFKLDHEAQFAIEKMFPDVIVRRNPDLKPVIPVSYTHLTLPTIYSV